MKKDFISELLSYGAGFAMLFLVVTALSIIMVLFLAVVFLSVFFERLLN